MPECNRFICGQETDGNLYCSERCEREAMKNRKRHSGGQAGAQREDYNRMRIITNDR